MPVDPYSTGIGALASIGGAFLGSESASKRRKQLEGIAKTPGVNIGGVYGDVFGAGLGALPQAQQFASQQNIFNLQQLQDLYAKSIPGFQQMQQTRAGQTAALLRGELPADVSSQVWRGAAGRALAGGYGGSPAFRNLAARDLGLTSLDLIGKGMTGMESLIRSTPMPKVVETQDLLNIDPRTGLDLRSRERSQRLEMMLGAANAPSSMDVWGSALTQLGGGALGYGLGGMGGGGGGGMGGSGATPATDWWRRGYS
jgi:hypothetical protein